MANCCRCTCAFSRPKEALAALCLQGCWLLAVLGQFILIGAASVYSSDACRSSADWDDFAVPARPSPSLRALRASSSSSSSSSSSPAHPAIFGIRPRAPAPTISRGLRMRRCSGGRPACPRAALDTRTRVRIYRGAGTRD